MADNLPHQHGAAPVESPPARLLKAIRLLNMIHSETLAAVDRELLRQVVALLWEEVDPNNGVEARARIW